MSPEPRSTQARPVGQGPPPAAAGVGRRTRVPAANSIVVLSIAATDSGGGAGLTADLKTFEAHGLWGAAAVTAVTAQNTLGVHATEAVTPELVRVQIGSVASDMAVAAAKTGMLATAEVVEAVVEAVRDFGVAPLVVDPVMASSRGDVLLSADGIDLLRDHLLRLATVVTPNLAEAAILAGFAVVDRQTMVEAARALLDLGPGAVLVTGGHLDDDVASPDCLLVAGEEPVWLESPRIAARNTHGTGCVVSAAICAELARGMEPAHACAAAKHFVERAIAAGVALGVGPGPVDPGWERHTGG